MLRDDNLPSAKFTLPWEAKARAQAGRQAAIQPVHCFAVSKNTKERLALWQNLP
jgi:hypothetical protein